MEAGFRTAVSCLSSLTTHDTPVARRPSARCRQWTHPTSSAMTPKEESWRQALNAFKGPAGAPPPILAKGFITGFFVAYVLYAALPVPDPGMSAVDRLRLAAKCLPVVGLLFFMETHLQVRTREESDPKLTFDPSGSIAAGIAPYPILRNDRIHANQIEAFMYFLPALLSMAALEDTPVDARIIPSMVLTWTASRAWYRIGYSSDLPIRRLYGMAAAMVVSVVPMMYGVYRFVTDVIFV